MLMFHYTSKTKNKEENNFQMVSFSAQIFQFNIVLKALVVWIESCNNSMRKSRSWIPHLLRFLAIRKSKKEYSMWKFPANSTASD